jgi:hypothetical protein
VVLVATLALLGACVYEDAPPRQLNQDPNPYPPAAPEAPAPPTAPSAPSGTPSSGNGSPMLVEIDTDQTMNAVGGEGVGVFVEYASGGKWHVWWTCDTKQTKQDCDFVVSAAVSRGTVSNVDATELPGGFVTSSSPSRVDAKSTTANEAHGVRFQTMPGAIVTIEAAVGALTDGAFLFFVQDGKVNGGFAGKLTNPLQFQGKTP